MYNNDDEELPLRKSKSQQKREAEAAQALGTEIVGLSPNQFKLLLEKTELPDKLQEALEACRSIKAHEARRRQMQFIGKLMRDVELEPIQQLLEQFRRGGQIARGQQHQLERWRERLLTEGEAALTDLINQYPQADSAQLTKLIASAHKEFAEQQPPKAARLLFKYLRDLLGA